MKKILLLLVFITIQLHSQTKSAKVDCKQFNENRRIKFEKFKIDNQGIEQYYNKVNKKILDNVVKNVHKINLRNKEFYIYIKYLNNRAYFDQNSCFDGIDQEYNFLIIKFWNKSVLEYAQKKFDKEIHLSTIIPRDEFNKYRTVINDETFYYLKEYYDVKTLKVKITSLKDRNLEIPIPIEVQFITPYKIKVNDTKNITTYEYKKNKWKIIKD